MPDGDVVFVITGSQTGKLKTLKPEHYTVVYRYDPEKNYVADSGPIKASSEAMTHAAVYRCGRNIRAVFHIHNPLMWKLAVDGELKVPLTGKNVPYGTPGMAKEVERLSGKQTPQKKEYSQWQATKTGS